MHGTTSLKKNMEVFSIAPEMEKFVPFALLLKYRLLTTTTTTTTKNYYKCASAVFPYFSDMQIATAFLYSSSVVCPSVQYFPTLSHKDRNFGGKSF